MRPKFSAMILGAAMVIGLSTASQGATVGPGGFDNGWATEITYDPNALRGVTNDRDNPLNALGEADSKFFEIGFGSTIDLTFGKNFASKSTVFEVTFNSVLAFPEEVELWVGKNNVFSYVANVSNLGAQNSDGGATVVLPVGQDFDTVRLIDVSPLTSTAETINGVPVGGFDVNAVRVAPVPLPAAGLLLLAGMGGLALVGRRKPS